MKKVEAILEKLEEDIAKLPRKEDRDMAYELLREMGERGE
jgi:hypothetical protein